MSTPHKEKLIRVFQLFQTTDEKTRINKYEPVGNVSGKRFLLVRVPPV